MSEQQLNLTINDIANGLAIIDAAIERGGVFRAGEMTDVVNVREKFAAVIQAVAEAEKARAEAEGEGDVNIGETEAEG